MEMGDSQRPFTVVANLCIDNPGLSHRVVFAAVPGINRVDPGRTCVVMVSLKHFWSAFHTYCLRHSFQNSPGVLLSQDVYSCANNKSHRKPKLRALEFLRGLMSYGDREETSIIVTWGIVVSFIVANVNVLFLIYRLKILVRTVA